MNIETIAEQMLNGEPIHDAIIIAVIFTCFIEFYQIFFSAVFTMFKK